MEYSYSTNEENYIGNFDSPESAAAEAFYDDEDLQSVWVGENIKRPTEFFVLGNHIIESIQEQAYEEAGEYAESWLENLPKEKISELEKVIADWIDANDPPHFWTVTNVKEITREAMIEAGQLDKEETT